MTAERTPDLEAVVAPGRRFGAGRVEQTRLGPFDLESGARLPELVVAFRHDGPGPEAAPQIVVIHALTGSADAAGDWWAPLIGPGRALDTDRYGVLCANLLGGRYGSTGPTSLDPRTGRPYGRRFPPITPRDQARAEWALLDALGIESLALVTGGSLGGWLRSRSPSNGPGGSPPSCRSRPRRRPVPSRSPGTTSSSNSSNGSASRGWPSPASWR